MPHVAKQKAVKGSQRWLQELVNQRPALLTDALRTQMSLNGRDSINWLSPQATEGYAEYQDEDFLEKLSVHLENRPLHSFWPSGGPVWDALGKTSRGDVLLVETKAHVGELVSNCGACPSSLALIQSSLDEAGRYFGVATTTAWSQMYYQYANRLAHLYLLRQLNGIPAWLIFLYFLNADDVSGPGSVEEWENAIEKVHAHLGINRDQLGPFVIDVFFDVTTLHTAQIDEEHSIQGALGTLQQYRVWVESSPHGHRKLCSGFPTMVDACDSKDALWQVLRQSMRTS